MEIRIGIQHSPREIVIETDESADTVSEHVAAALSEGAPLRLSDAKGRRVLIPGDKIAYAELATEEPRRVGFLG